ncbi:ABC transporter permease [Aeromicrobium duanguangcaii]|uniref:ABC transporter permease n=1 Tax=Aeromicrobium duanguangcaii TaxID=2968086 RepID=A0ABY5KBD8_9ACTN|nr:ABC transporter permease [Aeromicrobium duanguangcaii]MCD9154970.1 ABC transporter permease [Aeromicrobium duanguangcaii]MCL3838990.1 ABC transporter permease [Aeromicrobium duanguangcaii]UUI67625.1 ABC transporter permease [Aeromicrobium duanguangcaii]
MREVIRPGQERFVAPLSHTPLEATGTVDESQSPESQWLVAWKSLRSNWIFWVSAVILLCVAVVVAAPGLFTDVNPLDSDLGRSLDGPSPGHPAGFDKQGYDVFARTIYGARASVLVGILCTLVVAVLGIVTGMIAGFYGGVVDAIVSRVADMFFAIPLLLGAIVGLSMVDNRFPERGYWGAIFAVVFALAAFGWPQVTRIARGAVLEVKNLEFIDAARAIGASPMRNLVRHVLPNSLPPVIVVSTVSLGIFIVAEATLSFLGIGLPYGIVSWGNDIAAAQNQVRSGNRLGVMYWPAGALMITALGFILLGDAVSDALDPKRKNR